jgi:serine/threonine protein kinase
MAWIQKEEININKPINKTLTTSETSYENYDESDIRLLPVLYIQMELCHLTLYDAMKQMNETLNQSKENGISLVGCYISYELLKQIIKGVNYLHTRYPPIIHRDLKPMNILITNNGNNDNFVKITDFGLATIHESICNRLTSLPINHDITHTTHLGTPGYRAPEINKTGKYDTRADMYSIGIIIEQLFCIKDNILKLFNFNNKIYEIYYESIANDTEYFESENINHKIPIGKIYEIKFIHQQIIKQRDNCQNFLSFFNKTIDFNDIKYENVIKKLCYKFGELKYRPKIEEFVDYFLWSKIRKDILSKKFLQFPVEGLEWINNIKINYKLSMSNSQEIISIAYHELYTNIITTIKEKYKTLLKKLCDNTHMKWYRLKHHEYINWYNCDYLLLNEYYSSETIIFFNVLENYKTNCNPNSIIIYCSENYNNYEESVLCIVNEVMHNNLENNIELKQIEINRQLNELLKNQVYCYVLQYLYISEKRRGIEIAIRYTDYNIIISSEQIVKLNLSENLIENFPKDDKINNDIIRKKFEGQNYLYDMNCVSIIEINGSVFLLIQEYAKNKKCKDHQYMCSVGSYFKFKFSIERTN